MNIITNTYLKILGEHLTCKAKGQEKDFDSGKGQVQDCIFPFIHKGQKFDSCAASDDGGGDYCATKVDSNGYLVGNNWARCNKYCDHCDDRKFYPLFHYVAISLVIRMSLLKKNSQ